MSERDAFIAFVNELKSTFLIITADQRSRVKRIGQ